MNDQAKTKLHLGLSVVIGPFYQNLAMILEELEVPYIVTDYMGFDWSDISRVDDNIQWKNMLEVRPPMREFNGAIVDFLVSQQWESAVMIMPEYPKDNQGISSELTHTSNRICTENTWIVLHRRNGILVTEWVVVFLFALVGCEQYINGIALI